jgi:chemotaxis-related protein WspB
MLFLLFQLGDDRYALEARRVVEVIPLVSFKRLSNAPAGVAGFFNYRGEAVPAIDLCSLTLGHPASERLSTRIIIVHYPDAERRPRLLGLIAEKATQTIRKEKNDFTFTGIQAESAPYLGPILVEGEQVIQWLHEDRLLPENVSGPLFQGQLAIAS